MVRTLLYKVMPQDTGGILKYTDVHGDIGRLIFDSWPEMTFLDIE